MTSPTRHRSRPSLDASLALVASLLAAVLVLSLALAPSAEAFVYWAHFPWVSAAGPSLGRANLDGTGQRSGQGLPTRTPTARLWR
jgi:hypothetical protein